MVEAMEISDMFMQHDEMFAMISSYLGDSKEGDLTRDLSKNIRFRETINGKTYENGLLHSFEGKPTFQDEHGTFYWYKDGDLHRDGDLPAIMFSNGSLRFYKNGGLHRNGDKPACVSYVDGVIIKCSWWRNGICHRDGNLPSVLSTAEYQFHQEGDLHREDGHPAIVSFYNDRVERQWFSRGELIDEDTITHEEYNEDGESFSLEDVNVW